MFKFFVYFVFNVTCYTQEEIKRVSRISKSETKAKPECKVTDISKEREIGAVEIYHFHIFHVKGP